MQDILIPATKRISYFFGWEDRVMLPEQEKKPARGLLRHVWQAGRVFQHLLSWIGIKTFGHGVSIGCDFDILCYVFDKERKLIETIAPGQRQEVNANASIFHNGDNDILGGQFDEELSLRLDAIPDAAHTILIYIRNDSDRGVTPHINAHLCLMNMTDMEEYFAHDISFAGHNEHGYIVGRLRKFGSSWRQDFIDIYSFAHPDGKENDFFAPYLSERMTWRN